VEVRAKLPGGRGTWPAIWMLPTDNAYGNWPKSGELDIMEHVGFDPGRVHFTVHTETYNHMNGNQQGANRVLNDPLNEFFVYTMEWYEDHADFFANSDKIFTFVNEGTGYKEWPFDKRFHLLLNIAVGGSWGGQQGIDTTIFPVSMTVDYVRVYQKNVKTIPGNLHNSNNNYNIKICKNPHFDSPKLTFSLPSGRTVNIKVFMVDGTQVVQKKLYYKEGGVYSIPLSGNSGTLSRGVYFLLFLTEHKVIKKKFYF
jgi:beta-glucanase (GH16 family)